MAAAAISLYSPPYIKSYYIASAAAAFRDILVSYRCIKFNQLLTFNQRQLCLGSLNAGRKWTQKDKTLWYPFPQLCCCCGLCCVYTVSRETLQFNGTHADMQGSEVLFVVCMLTNGQHTNQRVAMSVAARVFAGYKGVDNIRRNRLHLLFYMWSYTLLYSQLATVFWIVHWRSKANDLHFEFGLNLKPNSLNFSRLKLNAWHSNCRRLVAYSVRALGSQPIGREFESRARHANDDTLLSTHDGLLKPSWR